MKIDEKKLDKIYKTIRNEDCRLLLKLIPNDKGVLYTVLKKEFQKEIKHSIKNSMFSYYISLLRRAGLIVKSNEYWILTRIGVRVCQLMESFEQICLTYDLSDCNADGRIEMMVVERKL